MYDIDRLKWHWYKSYDQVSHGEAEKEVIWYGLELLVHLEADHDHEIAGDGHEAQKARGYADQGGLQSRIRNHHRR